jgi:hypothetical protein
MVEIFTLSIPFNLTGQILFALFKVKIAEIYGAEQLNKV